MSAADPQRHPDAEEMRRLQPAGFWIRVAASLLDGLILSPISIASVIVFFALKSMPLVLLLSVPGLLYKPLMEAFYGATLGKMICGIRVADAEGRRLSVAMAYVRFAPFLLISALGFIQYFWIMSQPAFVNADDFLAMARAMEQSPYRIPSMILNWVVIFECVAAAFTDRKRAIHDMLAGSYCVWKSTAPRPPEEDEPWEYTQPRQ